MSRLSLFDAMKAAEVDPETAPMRPPVSTQGESRPARWELVPAEPTEAMLDAISAALHGQIPEAYEPAWRNIFWVAYRAALLAGRTGR
jgi:hypothetical protein